MSFLTMRERTAPIRFPATTPPVWTFLCLAFISVGAACADDQEIGEHFDAQWSLDRLWDDGLAEVAIYDAERVIYGEPRPHEEARILVSEPMDARQHVKADPPYEGKRILPVLKCNIFSRVETKNYPYHLMVSLFIDRARPSRLVKATYSSQEWCGQTFKDLQFYRDPPRFSANSYWDGQAIIDQPLEWDSNTLLEEQLAVSLRALNLEAGEEMAIRLLPSQVSNRAPVPEPVAAVISRVERSDRLEGMNFEDGPPLTYELAADDGSWAAYAFGSEPPRVLLAYRHSDGRQGRMKSVRRRAYWRD